MYKIWLMGYGRFQFSYCMCVMWDSIQEAWARECGRAHTRMLHGFGVMGRAPKGQAHGMTGKRVVYLGPRPKHAGLGLGCSQQKPMEACGNASHYDNITCMPSSQGWRSQDRRRRPGRALYSRNVKMLGQYI